MLWDRSLLSHLFVEPSSNFFNLLDHIWLLFLSGTTVIQIFNDILHFVKASDCHFLELIFISMVRFSSFETWKSSSHVIEQLFISSIEQVRSLIIKPILLLSQVFYQSLSLGLLNVFLIVIFSKPVFHGVNHRFKVIFGNISLNFIFISLFVPLKSLLGSSQWFLIKLSISSGLLDV